MKLFIIPGNPPALYFYQLWAEEIRKEYEHCSIYLSPYPHLPSTYDSSNYLEETITFHGEKLLSFHEAMKEKVILVGHSIGAWIALQLLKKQDMIIDKCFLLYPFLERPTLRGRAILQSARALYKIPFMEDALLRSRSILEKLSKDLRYVTDIELRISLPLAYHECKVIGKHRKPLQIPEYLQKKLHMIYCDEDTWCPTYTVHEMKKWISSEKTEATHGFITSQKERAITLKALMGNLFTF